MAEQASNGHSIEIEPSPDRVVVTFNDVTVADSRRALMLYETGHQPVAYLPLEDVGAGVLDGSDHRTHCPFKGDAAYYHLTAGGTTAENAVWTYREPKAEVAEIKDHVAFYLGKVPGLELRVDRS